MVSRFVEMSVCVALVCAAAPAVAQQVGTYAGTTKDGNFVSFGVDKQGGNFVLTNADVTFTAACKHPDGTTNEGWGFFVGQNISGKKVSFVSNDDYYYISANLTFTSDKKIKGDIESRTAVFVPGATPPNASHFCISKKQSLTATFQAAGAVQGIPAGGAIVLAHPAGITAPALLVPLSR